MNGITANLTHVIRNGDPDQSYPGCVNLSFAFVEGESLLMALKDVALSSGRWGQDIVLLHEEQRPKVSAENLSNKGENKVTTKNS